MSLMPCFDKGQGLDESTVLARLLAGYGEIELQMCMCLIVVEGDIDTPIRAIFEKTGAERRIKKGRKALRTEYAKAGLLTELAVALADLDWCRQIRNQYSHCQWFWIASRGLCFVNLEELAKQPNIITSVTQKHTVLTCHCWRNRRNIFGTSSNALCTLRPPIALGTKVRREAGGPDQPVLFIQSR